jgi:Uma2 family endonuclease
MARTREATVDDLYRVEGKAEIVGGEIVLMSPTGLLPSLAAGQIFIRLSDYARTTKSGNAFTDGAGFVVNLPNRRSFCPDVAFAVVREWTGKFFDGAPIFAVEVRREGDYGPGAERAIARKRADYFAAGTRVVWDVDVLRDAVVRVYHSDAPDTPAVYRRDEVANAEPALPGFSMPVHDLFPGV